jgi:exopolysaccharide biosynthesis protein
MFSIAAFFIAFVFWFFDASIHYFVYGEPQFELIPDDFNELWMRLVIILLLILFGIFADYYSRKFLIAQKQLESSRIYTSMIHATHHILNNLLNQMQFFKIEALKSKDFDQEVLTLYDNAIDEASELIERLSHVENITEENIWASIDPNNIGNLSNKVNPDETKPRAPD